MSQVESRTQFLFVGNHPALDWVNTEIATAAGPKDLIGGYRDLARWLDESGLLGASETRGLERARRGAAKDKELAAAKRLRATTRAIAVALASARGVPDSLIRELNGALVHFRVNPRIVRAGTGYERKASLDLENPLGVAGLLAGQVADLLCRDDRFRVRRCENPRCVLYFLDKSKSHRRRWCSMSLCGNRAKAAAFYRRRGAARDNAD